MSILIEASDLCKSYGDIRALDRLSLQLKSGEILGLLGPNGAGKTSAIHIFLGLLTPSHGEVRVLGHSPLNERHQIAHRINFSSAYVYLPSNLKVRENLKIFSKLYNIKNSKTKMEGLLEEFGISHLADRLVGALSSGEKTKVNLCKSLLNDPELLLLDEPTASLDPEMADEVRKKLRILQRERAMGILYTSHNMHEVEQICDRVLFINKGKMVAVGTPKQLVEKFGSKTLEEVFIKLARDKI